jgi:hypothetical protein
MPLTRTHEQVQGTGNKAGFAIFCDDGNSASAAAVGNYPALASEKDKSKENTRAPSKWTKEEAGLLTQKPRAPRPAGLPLPFALYPLGFTL